MSKPTLVFIPGMWEGPTVFSDVLHILQTKHNYPTHVIPLVSTGTNGPTAKTYTDDVASIRSAVQDLVEKQSKELLLIMHSAGAYTGSDAIKDLGLPFRKSHGLQGGVRKLVYLSGGLLPEDADHPPVPFFETTGEKMHSRDPIPSLFNDLSPASAEKHAAALSWQPSTYVSGIHVNYGAWKDVPSVYLYCTQDQVIPLVMQRQIAAMAGAETESCDAGHMVMLSQPERVVEFVVKAAAAAEV